MFAGKTILPQSSIGFTGFYKNNYTQPFANFESNPSGYSSLKDWGLSFSSGTEFSSESNANLYSISVSKRMKNSLLSLRYTPGYQKEFIFKTGEVLVDEDSSLKSLQSQYIYKEIFGLGYSYSFNKNFSAGLSIRYFTQEFQREEVNAVFLDTLFLETNTTDERVNLIKTDLGINYNVNDNLSFSLGTINLLNSVNGYLSDAMHKYQLDDKFKIIAGVNFSPFDFLNLNLLYESDNSFQAGINSSFRISDQNFSAGISIFHDEQQLPFIAGIIPYLSYQTKFFQVSLSAVDYFSNRNKSFSVSDFTQSRLPSITNNKFSFDKAVFSVSFFLNTINEQAVQFIDVEILNEIYPALSDNYVNTPFAEGKIVNLTEKPVTVKPESRIKGITSDKIQSPEITIAPFDTAEVYFYTFIPDDYNKTKSEISYADFFISSINDEPDDQIQTPVLINGINAWDGQVINLKKIIKRNFSFAIETSKKILSQFKNVLDSIPDELHQFYKGKLIFDSITDKLTYIADPRASAEYVQFPEQTLELRGGDCDDLSVLYSSLLESAGVETALVDYRSPDEIRHVNVMFNTELSPDKAREITVNDRKFFTRKNEEGKNEIWLIIETTSLTDFNEAWNAGMKKFNQNALDDMGLAKGYVEIVDVN